MRHSGGGGGMQLPQLTKVNKILIIVLVGSFLLVELLRLGASIEVRGLLGLSAGGLSKGYIHTLFTYPFISFHITSLLFDGLILWFIGSDFEGVWGAKKYLKFLAGSALGGGLIFVVIGFLFFSSNPLLYYFPLSGMTGVTYALLLAYAIIYPDRTLYLIIFPVKAKYFAMIVVALQFLYGLTSPSGIQSWGHLGAMGAGYLTLLWLTYQGKGSELLPKYLQRRPKGRGKLSLVEEEKKEKKEDPKYWQ